MQILVTRVKTRLRLKKNALLHVTIEYKTTFGTKTRNTVNSFFALDTTNSLFDFHANCKIICGICLTFIILAINVVQTL